MACCLLKTQLRHFCSTGGLNHQKLGTRPIETGIQSMNKGTWTNGRGNLHHRKREDQLISIDHSENNDETWRGWFFCSGSDSRPKAPEEILDMGQHLKTQQTTVLDHL